MDCSSRKRRSMKMKRSWPKSSGRSLIALALIAIAIQSVVAANQSSQMKQQGDSASPSINLIPVDQPIVSSGGRSKAESTQTNDAQSGDSSASASVQHEHDGFGQQSADGETNQSGEEVQSALRDGAQRLAGEVEPSAALGSLDSLLAMSEVQGPINEPQVSLKYPNAQVSAQQIVERRLGLFKKGSQYGVPMSANYAGSYMTDCERCLIGQSADLQQQPQLDPLPPPPATPIAPAAPPPSFGPLKNKLFMKFPFFMKPISSSFGDFYPPASQHDSVVPYWHQYQPAPSPQPAPPTRPQLSNALYLRPAPAAAYNCIQATPPLLAAPLSHEVALAAGKGAQGKQYQHQQQQISYPSSQY